MSIVSASASASSRSASPVRLAMLGMIEGNGHPYSWSAIVNGFDSEAMTRCPFPVIPKYLGAQPRESVRVPGAQVTHIWTDNPADAPLVAAASLIPNVVAQPTDVIGHVDAVMIATDDGFDHVRRAEPFVRVGLPVFVDKPLALTVGDLKKFVTWQRAGARLQSSSGLRYAPELDPVLKDSGVGELRWISATCCKTWERYGIHLLEPVYRLLGPGFVSVRLESQPDNKTEVAHLLHCSGVQFTLPIMYDAGPAHGLLTLCGTAGAQSLRFTDTYTAFRRQMLSFIEFVRTGTSAYSFAETIELMCVLIAGLRSRAEQSRRVTVAEIQNEL
jgi:predicted dehydrogenase